MFTFASKEEFEDAVAEFLKDNLRVNVNMERSRDYYSNEMVPVVEVYVRDEKIYKY